MTSPVEFLKEIEECCRGSEAGLPRKTEVSNGWSGIAFSLGNNNLLAPMDDVVEIPVYGLPHSFNAATAASMALYEYCRQYPTG